MDAISALWVTADKRKPARNSEAHNGLAQVTPHGFRIAEGKTKHPLISSLNQNINTIRTSVIKKQRYRTLRNGPEGVKQALLHKSHLRTGSNFLR
jgi:hypothetical protein